MFAIRRVPKDITLKFPIDLLWDVIKQSQGCPDSCKLTFSLLLAS